MSNFWQRALTGALFVIVMAAGILLHDFSMFLLLFFLSVMCLWEFMAMTGPGKKLVAMLHAYGSLSLLWCCFFYPFFNLPEYYFPVLLLLFQFICLGIHLFTWKGEAQAFSDFARAIAGVFYTVFPFACIFAMVPYQQTSLMIDPGKIPDSIVFYRYAQLGFFILVWSSDTFAYLCGRAFGKHPLYSTVSPKKTVEGALGGVVLTMAAAWLYGTLTDTAYDRNDWLIIGLIISVTGPIGDLVESMLKRSYGIKDSGVMLPGHGGFLDRFDAAIFAAPFVFFYCHFLAF